MAGTFPTTVIPAQILIEPDVQTFTDRMHGGQYQTREKPGSHRWLVTAEYPILKSDEWLEIAAFINSQSGSFDSFSFPIHTLGYPRKGAEAGSGLTNGAHTKGDSSIATNTWTLSTLIAKGGEFLKFGNHNKLYWFNVDATSDGGGAVTISISPKLFVDVPNNTQVLVNSLNMTVKVPDSFKIPIVGGQFSDGITVPMFEDTT